MSQRLIATSALASILALGLAGPASAADTAGKEKCFGIAKAGHNDCANLSGSHSCAGQAQMSDSAEWNYVAKGTCKDMGGLTMEEAKMKLASDKKMEPMKK
jgi:uncharacterized membrane protein